MRLDENPLEFVGSHNNPQKRKKQIVKGPFAISGRTSCTKAEVKIFQ